MSDDCVLAYIIILHLHAHVAAFRVLLRATWMLSEMPPERFFASPESNKNVAQPSESSSASRLQLSVTSPGAAGRGQECPFRFAVSPP